MADGRGCPRELCCMRVIRQEERCGSLQWVHCLDCGAMLAKSLLFVRISTERLHTPTPVNVLRINASGDRSHQGHPQARARDLTCGYYGLDASVATGSVVSRYAVVPFAGTDRNAATI